MANLKDLAAPVRTTRADMMKQINDLDLIEKKKPKDSGDAKEGEGYGGKPSSSRKAADEFREQEKRNKGK